MFSELPKLFDRNFAIGYFLPMATFITISYWLMAAFEKLSTLYTYFPALEQIFQKNVLQNTTILLGLMALLGAIFLLAINRELYKFMEGYGRFNPFHLISKREEKRFKRYRNTKAMLDKEQTFCTDTGIELSGTKKQCRHYILRKLAEEFPSDERFLLPTAFGNAIRAFESYSGAMHGLEAVEGWNRLISVIPTDYRTLVESSKALTDFWLNIWFLSTLLCLGYAYLTIATRQIILLWVPFALLLLIYCASEAAKKAAVEWGNLVKSAFDVFLPTLCEKLGFMLSGNKAQERAFWSKFGQAVTFRDAESMNEVYELQSRKDKA